MPDTSVLIPLLRSPGRLEAFVRYLESHWVRLSSVVLAELYAGARSEEDAQDFDLLVKHAREQRRLVSPDPEDWIAAGRVTCSRQSEIAV